MMFSYFLEHMDWKALRKKPLKWLPVDVHAADPNLKVGENEMVESVSAFDFSLFMHS